ncbi:Ig-like domain-containing protein [Enterobacter hormaechei]|nr:Ig-like domain-containing protein [Enterobacter hormaechei]MCM8103296.1 Ig-like domain-containing protein [Enterobacter hormaechei]MEB7646833.1 Ig-like domain-containing protein [Enterobacter hormaechei]
MTRLASRFGAANLIRRDRPLTPTVTDSVSQITGPVLDGESTNDPRPVLSGTGTPNDVITIYDQVGTGEPQAVGSVTVDGNGNWS